MMELKEAIEKRWSCRHFDLTKDVSSKQIEELIKRAIRAPSAGNLQPWRFYVIRNEEVKQEIVAGAGYQSFIAEAPVVIVVCAEIERLLGVYGARGKDLYAIQDTAAAIQNILLSIIDLGLASCWVGAFEEAKISNAIQLPAYQRPLAILPIGHPSMEPKNRPRKPMDEVTVFIE